MRALIFVAMLVSEPSATPSAIADPDRDTIASEVAALKHRLARVPGDVDARFALALRLSWLRELAAAEDEAESVVVAAPSYWDAHVLLARLAGWTQRYELARERVGRVLIALPQHVEALTLAVDIELWAERPQQAWRRAQALLLVEDSAESRLRAARAAEMAMGTLETRRWAKRALELEPAHAGARSLLASTHLARFASVTEFEFFPIDENAMAIGQLIAATAFPTSKWSATVAYDYRLRFGTNNHRASAAVARRLSQRATVDASLRVGSTEVVPELSAQLGGRLRFMDHYSASLSYLGDKMPWPGQLHRARLGLGAGLPHGVEFAIAYEGGVLRACGNSDPVQSLQLRSDITRGALRGGLRYGFGMELDRAPLAPFLEERFGDDVCQAADEGVDVSLRDTRAQIGGAQVGFRWGRIAFGAGYTVQYRFGGDVVHISFVSLDVYL